MLATIRTRNITRNDDGASAVEYGLLVDAGAATTISPPDLLPSVLKTSARNWFSPVDVSTQLATKRPSASAAILGVNCQPSVAVLTTNSPVEGAPSASKIRARTA